MRTPTEPSHRLFLWVRRRQVLGPIHDALSRAHPQAFLHPERSCLVIPVAKGAALEELASLLAQVIPVEELEGARVLLADGAREPSLSDLGDVVSLSQLVPRSQLGWLQGMLEEARTTTWFQPIVYANQTDRIFGQEALLRGLDADGNIVPPLTLLSIARANDLLAQLELAAQRSAIQLATQHDLSADLFINMSPAPLHSTELALRKGAEAIRAAGIAPARVVFELTEADKVHDVGHLLELFEQYRRAGFRVALDDLGSGYASLNLLHQLRPDIVKLDMGLIRGVHADPFKAMLTEKTLEAARSIGVHTVAEGVETRAELEWLRARKVDFVQGYLVARPASPPPKQTPRL